jgi:hypothetical protein
VEGCIGFVVSHGLCDKHRTRLRRHGHLEQTRPADWGTHHKHELWQIWKWRQRHSPALCPEWQDDFAQFIKDVGPRPKGGYVFCVIDKTKPVDKGNVEWREKYCKNNDKLVRKKRAQYAREYRANNPTMYRDQHLQRSFGITSAQYQELLASQNGVCAICGEGEKNIEHKGSGAMTNLAVDHCHKTGIIRGILCISCNRALGGFKDSPELLQKAAQYVIDSQI